MKQNKRSVLLLISFFSIATLYLSAFLAFYSSWLWRNSVGFVLVIVISPGIILALVFILLTFLRLNKYTELIRKKQKLLFLQFCRSYSLQVSLHRAQ